MATDNWTTKTEWMKSDEVLELLGIDQHTLHAYVHAGKLEILLSPWGTFYREDGVLRLAMRLRLRERRG